MFANGYIAPLVVEVRGDNLDELDEQAKAVAEVARTVPGVRDVGSSLADRLPRGPRRHRSRRRPGSSASRARDAAQTTLEATLGNINTPSVWIDPNNGQSYYVVTYYDGATSSTTRARSRSSRCASATTAAPVTLGAYGDVRRSRRARSRSSATSCSAPRTSSCRPRGATSAAPRAELEAALATRPAHARRQVRLRRPGRARCARPSPGSASRSALAVMVVFMIMASQFKSLRLPFVMLFTIPVSLVGIVLALMAGGQGFSITALMGILDGHRHRGVERHPARRRRQRAASTRAPTRSRRSSPRRARASCPSR